MASPSASEGDTRPRRRERGYWSGAAPVLFHHRESWNGVPTPWLFMLNGTVRTLPSPNTNRAPAVWALPQKLFCPSVLLSLMIRVRLLLMSPSFVVPPRPVPP